jgi:hypothetical protein
MSTDPKQHGDMNPGDGVDDITKGVHVLQRFADVVDETARALVTIAAADMISAIQQTAGAEPGLYLTKSTGTGLANWVGPIGVSGVAAIAPQLHNTIFNPIGLWQLQDDGAQAISLLDTAGDAGGPYDLTAIGTPRIGSGHGAGFQSWVNQSERMDQLNADLNLIAGMAFACVVMPSITSQQFLVAWNGPGGAESANFTYAFEIFQGQLLYGHEHGAGINNQFQAGGIILGIPQHLAFTRSANGRTVKLFIQGVKVGENTFANGPSGGGGASNKFSLGEEGNTGALPLIGGILSAVLYDTELTEGNILQLAKRAIGF